MNLLYQALIALGVFILGVYAITVVALFGAIRLWGGDDDRPAAGLTLALVILPAGILIVPLGAGLVLVGVIALNRRSPDEALPWTAVAWPVGIALGLLAVLLLNALIRQR